MDKVFEISTFAVFFVSSKFALNLRSKSLNKIKSYIPSIQKAGSKIEPAFLRPCQYVLATR